MEIASLIDWADTIDAEYLYWIYRPDTPPDQWPVALESANDDEWELFGPGCVTFLTDVLTGKTTSWYLDDLAEDPGPSFRPYKTPPS